MPSPKLSITAMLAALALGWLAAGSAAAEDPAKAANNTWITVSGTVASAGPDAFRLDYGKGVITVEMDDFDFYAEGHRLIENDQVIVNGKIDNDLFEKKKIEATSVYVENLGTHFYASAVDEEDFVRWNIAAPVVLGRAEVTGTVTAVDGREFTVDFAAARVQVDTSLMPFNPMDDKGFLEIEVGDRVKVAGEIDRSFVEAHEILADTIVELQD